MMQRSYRACTLCEATCGIVVETEGREVVSVRGDEADPFSKGYICPKAYALKDLQNDPDRLRRRARRTPGGWQELSWEQALGEAAEGLLRVRERQGQESLAIYLGNPAAHNLGSMLYGRVLIRALGSHQRFSATSLDQLPKMISSAILFGEQLSVPVPDIDRTAYLVVIGANPVVSNGSLMTAPGMPKRLRALCACGGKLVVVDPRRTETARLADEHLAIRPGTDAMFPTPAASFKYGDMSQKSRKLPYGRWKSRVRDLPEFSGELPAVTLAEEIETAGEGQIRGLVTLSGNPVLSTPAGARLARALD